MSRDLSQAAIDALNGNNVPAIVLVSLAFDSPVNVCNAGYGFTWNGTEYMGIGNLGKISGIEEGTDMTAYGVALEMSGIPAEMISLALGEQYQGRDATIWYAPLDEQYNIIADPVIAFKGRIDTMNIELGDTATITCTIESKMVDWDRPRVRRFNSADQNIRYPQDLGFQFVESLVDKQINWGRV